MGHPRISFVTIVLNGMPFIECALRAVYPAAHEIIVVEGAVSSCLFAANPDGSSTDGTVEAIRRFPDPDAKIRLVQGKWPEKLDMHNKALEFVTGDYVWLVDADEIYKEGDIERVRDILAADRSISRVDFIPDNFWKGFDYLFVSERFSEEPYHYRRVFRLLPGARFTSHRPPTLCPEQGRVLGGEETRRRNIFPYHYSYVLWSQVCQKIELYHRYGWGKHWVIDLDEWFRDFFCQWRPENREELEARFPVWTGDPASRTVPFTGEHPAVMQELIGSVARQGYVFTAASENESRTVIGDAYFQKMTLRAWDCIQLDEPLRKRYEFIRGNVEQQSGSFWNNHVALAFLARMLSPVNYLEVGVRTGGSLVQVLYNGDPRQAVAVDRWAGSYAGMPNTLDFTKQQIADVRRRAGNRTRLRFIRGNSHRELKRLISEKSRFDLITIDGDHTREGAWEDLEDAVSLLGARGAIVFDDIIHPSHRDLFTLCHRLKLRYPEFSVLLNTEQDNGCAIFLKNIDIEELFARARRMAARNIRVAGEGLQTQQANLTSIDRDSEFARSIVALFEQLRPQRVIETGTFHGDGTTRIIASALRDLKSETARFFSIECNHDNLMRARENLARNGLLEQVELVHGLSVPRSLLPSAEVIREKLVEAIDGDGIYVDHDAAVRTQRYYAETDFRGIPDDRLGHCIERCDGAPDFVLLDSGGHMGNVEFNYLLGRLSAPCHIALDDINHVKHRRSYQQILKDPRFTLTAAVPEKFGFCIARFTPTAAGGPAAPTRLLWIRTDAIGDNILSLPALSRIREAHPTAWVSVLCQEGLAEIYAACPFVDEVLTFVRRRAHEDPEYRQTIVKLLQELRADICIAPVLSREELTDHFVLGSRAEVRVAFDGNDCNISPAVRRFHNQFYTKVVTAAGRGIRSEFRLNEALLSALEIPAEGLAPQIWLTDDDAAFARRILEAEGLDPARTLAFFAGARDSHRLSQAYGGALEAFCGANGFAVVALGGARDGDIIQRNVAGRGFRVVDLTGKTTIRQAAAVIARCALAVGAETGLAHIAAAVSTPHVILLGGGHFGRFMPSAATTTAVALPLECFGCNWHCRYPEHYCVKGVTDMAIGEAIRLTNASRSDRPRLVLLGPSCWSSKAGSPVWDDAAVRNLDLAVAVTIVEQDGTVRSFDQEAAPCEASSASGDTGKALEGMGYETLLAQYGLDSKVNPLRRAFYAFLMRSLSGKSVADVVRDNLDYLKTWMRGRWR